MKSSFLAAVVGFATLIAPAVSQPLLSHRQIPSSSGQDDDCTLKSDTLLLTYKKTHFTPPEPGVVHSVLKIKPHPSISSKRVCVFQTADFEGKGPKLAVRPRAGMKKEWKDDLAVYKRMDAILATELDMWAIIEDFASTSGSVPLEGTTRWRLAVAAKRDPSVSAYYNCVEEINKLNNFIVDRLQWFAHSEGVTFSKEFGSDQLVFPHDWNVDEIWPAVWVPDFLSDDAITTEEREEYVSTHGPQAERKRLADGSFRNGVCTAYLPFGSQP